MKSEYFEQFSSLKFKEGFSLIMSLLHPFSRGFIKLRSRDPFAPPLIFPKFFSDPRDMKAIIDGIKKSIRLVTHSRAFRKLGTKFFDKPNPACFPKFTPFSDDYWECIGKFTIQIHFLLGLDNNVFCFVLCNVFANYSTLPPTYLASHQIHFLLPKA